MSRGFGSQGHRIPLNFITEATTAIPGIAGCGPKGGWKTGSFCEEMLCCCAKILEDDPCGPKNGILRCGGDCGRKVPGSHKTSSIFILSSSNLNIQHRVNHGSIPFQTSSRGGADGQLISGVSRLRLYNNWPSVPVDLVSWPTTGDRRDFLRRLRLFSHRISNPVNPCPKLSKMLVEWILHDFTIGFYWHPTRFKRIEVWGDWWGDANNQAGKPEVQVVASPGHAKVAYLQHWRTSTLPLSDSELCSCSFGLLPNWVWVQHGPMDVKPI